jgi:hypothetical protein
MSTSELIECPESTAIPQSARDDSHWYTLASWPPSPDREPRLMLALHRTTGECHIDWATIERAAEDVTDQGRHLARAMLAIRENVLATFSRPRRGDTADHVNNSRRVTYTIGEGISARDDRGRISRGPQSTAS